MLKFKAYELNAKDLQMIKGGDACQDLNNCYASRHGACIYSNDYGQCMYNQAQACDTTFLAACLAP